MSGISKSFKLPALSVAKRRKVAHGLPTFNWKDVKNLQPLAVGIFGYVYCANYVFLEEDKIPEAESAFYPHLRIPEAESAFYPHLRIPEAESASAIPFRIPYPFPRFIPTQSLLSF